MNPADRELIKRYVLGGSALGGSAALVTSLINHLSTLEGEREEKDKEYKNKLFQDAVVQSRKTAVASARGGLAITGGIGSSLITYALVKELYREMKKSRLQDELDESKTDYVDTLNKSAAGKPMSGMEALSSIPVALPILLAIGSGLFANYALGEHFPTRRNNKRKGLRPAGRMRLQDIEEEEDGYKEASAVPPADLHLLGLLALGACSKKASALADIIGTVLDGNEPDFTEAFITDPIAAMGSIKGAGAALEDASEVEMAFALGIVDDNPIIKPATVVIAASEFADAFPRYTELSRQVDHEFAVKLAELATATSQVMRQESAEGMEEGGAMAKLKEVAEGHSGLMGGLNTLNASPTTSEDSTSGEE